MRLIVFILGLIINYLSLGYLIKSTPDIKLAPEQELLYFPESNKIRQVSFNYTNVFSNILWFNTVSYFGKHYSSDKNYHWFIHMCNVTTDLDPQHKKLFEFCAFLISWELKDFKQANLILTKSINEDHFWRHYYIRGMNKLIFEGDFKAANQDFILASQQEDALDFIKRIAEKQAKQLSEPIEIVKFLQHLLDRSTDKNQREIMQVNINKFQLEADIKDLQKKVDRYAEANSGLPADLKSLVKDNHELKDPFGGSYYLNDQGHVASTSKIERVKVF